MKGFAPVIIGVILLVSVLIVIIPAAVFKLHVVRILNLDHKLNNAQLALLVLLSSTHQGKNVGEIIGERVLQTDMDVSFLKEKLDKIVESKCYILKTESVELVSTLSPTCVPKEFQAKTLISVSYSPEKKTEEITLVMN